MAITDLDKYKSFIQEGQAGYESTPGQLGMVDPGIRYDPRQHSYAHDLYSYYLGGGMPPAGAAGITTQVPGTTVQGTGGGGGAQIPGAVNTLINTGGGAQNPLTQMITTPTGETMTVKEAMTRDPAYTGTVADPSGVTTAIAPPGILNPEQIELENIARAQAATNPRYAADVAPTTVDGITMKGRQIGGISDITDYLDPIDLDVTSLSPAAATIPAALTAGRIAKDAAGNWLYRGAAPGTKAATQAAAKTATAGQIGKAILKEGAFGAKGPFGFGTTNVGFDPAYKGAGATGRAGYIGQGLKSLTGAAAAGNIAGGTPAQRLAFEKALQSGAGRGIAGAARVAGLTTPIGAALTAATLTPMAIDALTRREPDATETSLFGMDLQDLEDRAAAYDAGETATLDDWGSPMGDVPDPTVTGITGPAGMDYADTGIDSRIADADTGYRDPIMDMVAPTDTALGRPTMADVAGPVQNITLPSGDVYATNDPQLLEKVDPETKENTNMIAGLWERAKGNITDFKNSLQDAGNLSVQQIGSLVNAFTQGATTLNITGALGIPGMIIGALAGAGTQVTPAQKEANAAFEAEHGITVGADGRINDPSGVLTGKVPAGKSFAGSATYGEMLQKQHDYFEGRKNADKSYNKDKAKETADLLAKEKGTFAPTDYEGEAYGTPDTITAIRDAEIDAGIAAADEEPGPTPKDFTPRGGGADRDPAPAAPAATFTPRGGGADRDPAPAPRDFTPRGGGADRDPAPSRPSGPSPGVPAGAGPPSVSGGGGGSGGCFIKGTPITMADGSTKPVEQVDLGDKIAEGGKVFAAGRFLTEELHDYEGIKVSGSHMVNEDGTWVRVRDSKKGKPLGDDEHTVYVFGAEHRRILIKGILFTDYFELPEQEQLDKNGDAFFINWKEYAEKANDQIVKILNAS